MWKKHKSDTLVIFSIILIVALFNLGTKLNKSINTEPISESSLETTTTKNYNSPKVAAENTKLSQDKNPIIENPPTLRISLDEMSKACQSLADTQLRNGVVESSAANYSSSYVKPSHIKNLSYYDAKSSICYFVTATEVFPRVFAVSDPFMRLSIFLYGVGMTPEGEPQIPNGGKDLAQLSAWCISSGYQYPKESYESECVNFKLNQTGAGTNNYSSKSLGVGVVMSKSDFFNLLNNAMNQDVFEVLTKLQF